MVKDRSILDFGCVDLFHDVVYFPQAIRGLVIIGQKGRVKSQDSIACWTLDF